MSLVGYLADGEHYVVIASNGGAATHPGWYHSLKAHPDVTIEVGTATIDALARKATGDERERLYRTLAKRVPELSEYERNAARVIPVMVLAPTPLGNRS